MLSALILILSCSTTEMTVVRLLNGDGRCSGMPLVLFDGQWRKVHSTTFDYRAAAVVCGELDCGNAVSITEQRDWKWKEIRVDVRCEGREASISQCRQYDFEIPPGFEGYTTFLFCSDSVKLVDGPGFCSGRLEVKSGDSWTTVCDTDFDWQDAEVVCRELGCGSPLSLQGALLGEGKHPLGSNTFQCNGTEKLLLTCSTLAREEQTCAPGSAVGLTCSGPGDVRVVGGGSRCAGKVELLHSGRWTRVESYDWSTAEARVVCRQLQCGPVATAMHVDGGSAGQVGWAFKAHCGGTEAELRACDIKSVTFVWSLAAVVCSDVLVQPSISFSAPINPSRGLQGPEVFRGHSFTITCSTQPQYPGGSFHLTLSWTNQSYTQAAVKHSASFLFPAADDHHQGNYSCVYDNHVVYRCERFSVEGGWYPGPFTHNFSSKSEQLVISITDFPLLAVVTRMLLVVFLLLISCWFIFLFDKTMAHFLTMNTPGEGLHYPERAAVNTQRRV